MVKKVDRSRKELACRVLAKYFVICATTPDAVIGPSLAGTELKAALADASIDFPVDVKFAKPIPKMPVHGFARKPVVTRSRRKISKESIGWMEEFSSNYEKRGSSPRAHTVRTEMLKVGGPLHRCEDGSLFVLDEGTISNWLKRRYTTQKSAGINLAVIAAAARANRQQQGGVAAQNTEAADGSDGGSADAESDDEEMDYRELWNSKNNFVSVASQ